MGAGARGIWRRALDHLELDLQVSCLKWVLGAEFMLFCQFSLAIRAT